MKKLSIIIPYYNTQNYTEQLLDKLNEQITNDVEVILVDDGSNVKINKKYEWINIIEKQNGGVSSARNLGIEKSCGQYISFIDSDDLVSDSYIERILDKITIEKPDCIYMSWKSLDNQYGVKLNTIDDEFPNTNLCVWNRVYKRTIIGKNRFNEKKHIAEDAEFIKSIIYKKKSFISDYMYYYRTNTPNSLTKRFCNGEIYSKRIVYNYSSITKDMDYLVNEIREQNKNAEVIVMTNNNELPELEKYALVMAPNYIKGTELKGEPTNLFKKIDIPVKTQIIIWTETTYEIGGIETFIYNFCRHMKDNYDIVVLYKNMEQNQIDRLKPYVRVEKLNDSKKYICNSLMINRINDNIPKNIEYQQNIQMVHGCRLSKDWYLKKNRDVVVSVSKVVEKSFEEEFDDDCNKKVIHDFTFYEPTQRVLKLISATRLSGEKGEKRMITLAEKLNEDKIPFLWFLFTERPLKKTVDGMVYMKPTLNIRNYMQDCDYLVQLSDSEAFGYSVVEALELGVPIISTPIPVLDELNIKDGINGIILPFEMDNIDTQRIYNSKFDFQYRIGNESIKQQWIDILGNTVPVGDYVYHEDIDNVLIRITRDYYSIPLERNVVKGEILSVSPERANVIYSHNSCVYV